MSFNCSLTANCSFNCSLTAPGDYNADGVVDAQDFNVWSSNAFTSSANFDPTVTKHLSGFTGRMFDTATGLQNNLNRWYDAKVGRWISEDPIGFAAGDANIYRYVGNSPTNYVDPSGLQVEVDKNKDGSTQVRVGTPFTIVILYGHGNKDTPHSFSFSPFTAGVFVGCDAGTTNKKIPPHNRIDGTRDKDGNIWRNRRDLKGDKDSAEYLDDKAMEGAKDKATEWLQDPDIPTDKVTIITQPTKGKGAWTNPVLPDVEVTLDGNGAAVFTEIK